MQPQQYPNQDPNQQQPHPNQGPQIQGYGQPMQQQFQGQPQQYPQYPQQYPNQQGQGFGQQMPQMQGQYPNANGANPSGNNMAANISYWAGIVSIGTDLLTLFVLANVATGLIFAAFSLILELTAITAGIIALALKQDSNKAWTGISLGGIGILFLILQLLGVF